MDDVMEFEDMGPTAPKGRLYNFATGRSELLAPHSVWLRQQIVPLLNRGPTVYIRLWGYASKLGAAGFNQRLSVERAEAVKRYLEQCAAQSLDFVEVGGYGESRSPGTKRDNSPVYRAVDVYVYRTSKPPPAPLAPPDVSNRLPNIYLGLGVRAGGHIGIGYHTLEAYLYSSDAYEDQFNLEATIWTGGLVLGGGTNLVFIVAYGATRKREFIGVKFDGWDFSASLGGRWGDFAKAAKRVSAVAKIARAIEGGAKTRQALRFLTKLSPSEWEKLGELVRDIRGKIGVDPAAKTPQINAFDIPFAGVALEAGIYKWWAQVNGVY